MEEKAETGAGNGAEETVKEPVAVKVTNLSPSTTVKDLHTHFAYAGTIHSIHLQPESGTSPALAYLTFLEDKALETALLLSETTVKGSLVKVEQAEEGYAPSPDAKFYGPGPLPKPQGAVKVSNLAPLTTATDLQDFFAFAGTVASIELHHGADGQPGEAFVSFYEKKAVDTAVLLSDAKVKGSIVTVAEAPGYTPAAGTKLFPPQNQGAAGENPVKAAEAMVRRLVEQGFTLGASTAQKAREFDQKHQLTRAATTRAIEFRDGAAAAVTGLQQKFMETPALFKPIQNSTQQVDKTFDSVDEEYKVTEKTQGVISAAEKHLNDFGSYLLQNKYFAQARDFISGTAQRVSDAIEGGPTSTSTPSSSASVDHELAATPFKPADEASEEKKEPEVDPLLKNSKEGPRDVDAEPLQESRTGEATLPGKDGKASAAAVTEPLVKPAPTDDDTPVF